MRTRGLLAAASARLGPSLFSARRDSVGVAIPIVTILDRKGRILCDEQRALAAYLAQDALGAGIIIAAGGAGEGDRLDPARRRLAARIVTEECRRNGGAQAWVDISARTRAETLDNLAHALEIKADAAVLAPLAIGDSHNPVGFVTREIDRFFARAGAHLPLILDSGAGVAPSGAPPHLHTRDVKAMSRLPYLRGVTITAGKALLGNYARAAAHFKKRGQFQIYASNSSAIFDLFAPSAGFAGHIRRYWDRYLTRGSRPDGIVTAAGNVMPREWRRAWQICHYGKSPLLNRYAGVMDDFAAACEFSRAGEPYRPTIACLKAALCELGVCTSDAVAADTLQLDEAERREFIRRFRFIRRRAAATLEPEWLSQWPAPPRLRANRDG